jgi:hypothetical protein
MSLIKRLQALVKLSSEKPPKEVFRVPVGGGKQIVGIEQEFILRLPAAHVNEATEIALPKQISPPEE